MPIPLAASMSAIMEHISCRLSWESPARMASGDSCGLFSIIFGMCTPCAEFAVIAMLITTF
jgi:hypothetical protein